MAVALSIGITAVAPEHAAAQCPMGATSCTLVRPDGKGIIGLGLIGAELGFIIPALAGVRDEWWPYVVFPLIGAVGGAIGGWAVEQNTQNDAGVDVALMAIGMALIVPTVVGTLALTAYQPPAASNDADEDFEAPSDEEEGTSVEATGGEGGGEGEFDSGSGGEGSTSGSTSSRSSALREILAGGPGVLRLDLGSAPRLIVAAPLPYSQSSYTAEERAHLLLNPASDFIVPVVSATF